MAIELVLAEASVGVSTVTLIVSQLVDSGLDTSGAGVLGSAVPGREKSRSPPISNETSFAFTSDAASFAVASTAGAIGSFFGSYGSTASVFLVPSGGLISGLSRSAVGVSLSRKMLSKSHIKKN